jgi:hypothetical protein
MPMFYDRSFRRTLVALALILALSACALAAAPRVWSQPAPMPAAHPQPGARFAAPFPGLAAFPDLGPGEAEGWA